MIWGAPLINPLSRGERNLMKANLLHTWVGFENETKPNCREFSGGRLNASSFCDWERVNSSIILSYNVIKCFLKGFLIFQACCLLAGQAELLVSCVFWPDFSPFKFKRDHWGFRLRRICGPCQCFLGRSLGQLFGMIFGRITHFGWLFNTLDTFQRYFNSTSFRIEVGSTMFYFGNEN